MSDILKDKVVVVTGAGAGIGREIALRAAKVGAKVIVNDIAKAPEGSEDTRSAARIVVDEIRALGLEAVESADSIDRPESAKRIIELALDQYSRVDAVINNAGILRDRMFFNMSDQEWDDVIRVHLYGYFHVSRAAAPHFKAQGSGAYVHFSSASGLIGNGGQANYAAAKMGVVGLSTGIALDMKRYNVRSNVVSPWAWSQLVASVPVKNEQDAIRREIHKNALRPEHVAPLCTFLASDKASDINGQIFGVRGKEVYLFSQPRIVKSAHMDSGWTEELLDGVMKPSFSSAFTDVAPHRDVVGWLPV